MRSFYARVEHNLVVGIDVVILLAVTSLILVRQRREMQSLGPTLPVR